MYLLDTNHCSRFLQNQLSVVRRVAEAQKLGVATCVIVRGELMHMAYNSEQIATNLLGVQTFLMDIRVYTLDEQSADIYGELKAGIFQRFGPREKSLRRRVTLQQLGVSDNDLWIAAISLRHNLVILSSDQDFERIGEIRPIRVENWLTG